MSTRILLVVSLFSLVGFSASSRAQNVGVSARPVASDAALLGAGYGAFWATSIPVGNGSVLSATLLDENLYVTTRAGGMYALQADTGLMRWAKHLDARLIRDRRPSHVLYPDGDGPVAVVTHSHVNVYDRFTGNDVVSLELPFPVASGAVADVRHMFLGGVDGEFYALRWSGDQCRAPLVAWHARLVGKLVSAPVLALGRVYFVSDAGVVYCVAREANRLIWAFDLGAEVAGGPQVEASGVYVAGIDHRVFVLDPDTGRRLNSHRLPGVLLESPTVVQRTLYQHCDGVGLHAFDVDTDRAMWTIAEAERFVARAAERLVLADGVGDLLFVDNRDGRVQHRLDLPHGAIAVPNPRDAVLYVVTPDGRVLCAKPLGFSYMRREAVMTARARLGFSEGEIRESLQASEAEATRDAPAPAVDRDLLRSRPRS